MKQIAEHLLPDSASVDKHGVMSIGGIDLPQIAAEFGTPVFVYDEEHLRARCREAVQAFGAERVVYATKAFLCSAMARLAAQEGCYSMSQLAANCMWRCIPAFPARSA